MLHRTQLKSLQLFALGNDAPCWAVLLVLLLLKTQQHCQCIQCCIM